MQSCDEHAALNCLEHGLQEVTEQTVLRAAVRGPDRESDELGQVCAVEVVVRGIPVLGLCIKLGERRELRGDRGQVVVAKC